MQRLTISARMYCLIALSLAILAGALTFSLFQSYSSMERERKAGLAYMNDIAMSMLKQYHAMESSGAMTREQAQAGAMEAIGAMRYGDGSGYFWINDMRPFMVMHPINAKLNGADLSQNKDPNGKHLFVEFVNTVRRAAMASSTTTGRSRASRSRSRSIRTSSASNPGAGSSAPASTSTTCTRCSRRTSSPTP